MKFRIEKGTITYRAAVEADLDWLIALRLATMDAYLVASGRKLTINDHRARVKQDFANIRIVAEKGRDVGMMKVVKHGSSWELVQVQFLPEVQGRGLGAFVVSELIAQAQEAAMQLRLSVLKVNPAKRLYARLGFAVVGDDGDSLLMRYEEAAGSSG